MTTWLPDLTQQRGPRYRAIADALAADITTGKLPTGSRLPTHRDLAYKLHVTVGTVSRAYAEAERRGLIGGEIGRGTFVRARVDSAPTPAPLATDWPRRYRHMRMHSCLHLLCAAVPAGVTGGSIGDGKGRLDFDAGETVLDKAAIEAKVNALIAQNLPVTSRWIDDAEMESRPELVRTMSVKPPSGQGRVRLMEVAGTDLQPCGGTHVRATGEIGAVRVDKIESKGKRNRRVSLSLVE